MGEMVQIPYNESSIDGYLALPKSGQGPGVIVLQEWWGLVPHIKDVADRFASAGYVALAPDLYHGESTTSPDQAGKLMMSLNIAQTQKELDGVIDFLSNHSSVSPKKIATVGFCMGGQLSLYAASKNDKVNACVIFYGIHPHFEPDLANIKAAVLGLYAENDPFVPVESVKKLEETLKSHGKTVEIKIYAGLDHAFFNDSREQVYNKEAAEDAWQRVLKLYKEHLY
ncbi:MAG: dienelactone hydrolase family protein [Acidobacteria bacterium]|nr:dienelactone hydrolase family protein [Acidobacteriota bacterium]